MKFPVTITKKSGNLENLRYTDRFISNGHWCVAWSYLKKSPPLAEITDEGIRRFWHLRSDVSIQRISDDFMDRVMSSSAAKRETRFEKTVMLFQIGDFPACRLFLSAKGSPLWIQERYVSLFQLEEVNGTDGKSPAWAGECLFVIMPTIVGELPKEIRSFITQRVAA